METTETTPQVQDAPTPEPADEVAAPERSARKERIGIVKSAKMDKTITVVIQRQVKHPMYGKYLKRSSKLMVHDEENDAGEGDTVRVMETRPISKHKRWRLVEIIERAK
jgi:small subunit ribosomal protein S17